MQVAFDYAAESRRVQQALRAAFGENTIIATDEGYHGRVHVKLVSPAFDGLSASQKQDKVWDILRERLGPDVQAVSLVEVYGLDQV